MVRRALKLAAAAAAAAAAAPTTVGATAPAASGGLSCGAVTATTIELTWPIGAGGSAASDLFYVAAFLPEKLTAGLYATGERDGDAPLLRPFFIQTAEGTTTTVMDLMPNASYEFRLRAHPASEPTISWGGGWGAYGAAVTCATSPASAGFPIPLRRAAGTAAAPHSITLEWTVDADAVVAAPPAAAAHDAEFGARGDDISGGLGGSSAAGAGPGGGGARNSATAPAALEVGLLVVGPAASGVEENLGALWRRSAREEHGHVAWQAVDLAPGHGRGGVAAGAGSPANTSGTVLTGNTTLTGLRPGTAYIAVARTRSQPMLLSDPVLFRTSEEDVRYITTYRISEYSFDVDFLDNHDSASVEALPLYLMTCDPSGLCSPWNKTEFGPDGQWDACQAYMQGLCPRGEGFDCLACADKHHDAIAEVCGNWTDEDSIEHGFDVHFFCGVGWPESLTYFSPITEYCVAHHLPPAPPVPNNDGYAQYISCNSDETDPHGNRPRDPICMCWVWDDRTLAMQPKLQVDAVCDSTGPTEPYVDEIVCNCSASGDWSIAPSDPSSRYIGRMPTYLPYGYYREPRDDYPGQTPNGENWSTPRNGSCAENQTLGAGGCTWKRLPSARVVHGPQLLAHGWNSTWAPDTPTDVSHTLANLAVFRDTLASLNALITPRCCGC